MMYAKLEVRKGRERDADIVELYWNQGLLMADIATQMKVSAGHVAKTVRKYWDAKTPTEKDRLSNRRIKLRTQIIAKE
jgi:DNA-directed RNA polymerase specialized sigma subunit